LKTTKTKIRLINIQSNTSNLNFEDNQTSQKKAMASNNRLDSQSITSYLNFENNQTSQKKLWQVIGQAKVSCKLITVNKC